MMCIHALQQLVIAECIESLRQFFTLVPLVRLTPEVLQQFFIFFLLAHFVSFIVPIRNHGNAACNFHPFHSSFFVPLPPRTVCLYAPPLRCIESLGPCRM